MNPGAASIGAAPGIVFQGGFPAPRVPAFGSGGTFSGQNVSSGQRQRSGSMVLLAKCAVFHA